MRKGNIIYANKQKVTNGEMRCFLGQMGIRNELLQATDYCMKLDEAKEYLQSLELGKRVIVYNTVDGQSKFIINAEDVATTYQVPEEVAELAISNIFEDIENESNTFKPAKGLDGDYSDWISVIECQSLIEVVITDYLSSLGLEVE